jgi:hypothetical protein
MEASAMRLTINISTSKRAGKRALMLSPQGTYFVPAHGVVIQISNRRFENLYITVSQKLFLKER